MKAEIKLPDPVVETNVARAVAAPISETAVKSTGARPYFMLDAWRGIASLWVVLFHVSGMIVQRDAGRTAQAIYSIGKYGGLGVQLFFVISGYCIVNAACASLRQQGGTWRFVKARCRRIYPPFWLASILAAAIFIGFRVLVARGLARPNIFSEQDYLHQSFAYYFGNITLLQVALHQPSLLAVAWTLCYEVAFYAIIALVLVTFQSRLNSVRLLQSLHIITIGCLLWLIAAPQSRMYPFDLWPQFGLGVAVYDVLQGQRRRLSNVLIAGVLALTLIVCMKPDLASGLTNAPIYLGFTVCLGFALLLCVGYRWDAVVSRLWPVRFLAWVGLFSYSLYLVHTLTMRIGNQVASILHMAHPLFLFAWSTVFCVATGYLFYLYCERPFLNRKPRTPDASAWGPGARYRNIAIVMPLSDLRGGGEMMLYQLITAAQNRGIAWHVLFFRDGPLVAKLNQLGVRTQIIEIGRFRDIFNFVRSVKRIESIIRTDKIDAVFSWTGHAHLYGGAAALLAKRPALWYHLDVPNSRDMMERLFVAVPAVGVLTLSLKSYAAQQQMWPRRPGRLVYPGVELARFDPDVLGAPHELRRKLGLPAAGPLIGMVGRLQRWKGMHTLIGAIPALLREYPDLHCVIVGGRHEAEPEYEVSLREQIARLGLSDKVVMAGLQQNVPEWMQAMDIVVHASDNEPFGIVVIEAMALGKPIVAGAKGGPEEILPDESCGLRTPFGDEEALAAAILRYLQSPEKAIETGRNAQRRAGQFSVNAYADNFVRSVDELLGETVSGLEMKGSPA